MALIRPLPTANGNYPRFIVWGQSTNSLIINLETLEKVDVADPNTATLNGVSFNRQQATLTTTFNCHIRQYNTIDTLEAVTANTPKTLIITGAANEFTLVYPD